MNNNFNFLKNNEYTSIYTLEESEIEEIGKKILIPNDLLLFYKRVGYGFINKTSSINRLLDPNSYFDINTRNDIYEFDPDLEIYEEYVDRKIFFEVNEGLYLMIDENCNKMGNNDIYYFDDKIAESLTDFLIKIVDDEDFLNKFK